MIPTVEEVMALTGTDTEAVMTAVRSLLSRGDVTSLHVSAGESVVRYERVATEEEAAQQQSLTYHDMVRGNPMEEYLPAKGSTDPYRQLFEMFETVEDAGFIPLVILSGRPMPQLREWLDLMSRKSKTVYGVRVVLEENIPEDCLILCGSDPLNKAVGPDAVSFSVKATLP